MAVAGSLTYDTKIDKNGFEKGLNSLTGTTKSAGAKIKSIVAALGIDKLMSSAFGLINSSLDGAISRLDTLNNYPKVMSNLGIAGDKAQKSINKMSDKLSGLPTTLDAGAMAVQRFTSANSDIEKSTDYFLALNNAILAGGASTDIQSTALEQLSQAYAKNKPDMIEWRSLMTAMPAQLKQVATAMGYVNTDALGDDLRKGKVSMEDFMDTIVKLNNEGVNGFQSFEEQARNSTGGIATSITVAKTQVVKGVADIIQSLDQSLKDEGLGGISEIISNLGKKAKEILDFLAEKIPLVIKKIKESIFKIKEDLENVSFKDKIDLLKNILMQVLEVTKQAIDFIIPKIPLIIEMLDKILPLIVGITVGIKTFQTIISIINGVQKAMALLNAVMAVNPIILIVAAIAGLVAGFIYLWNTSEKFRNFWIELWEKIKTAFISAWNAIKIFFTETIPKLFNNLIDWFSKLPENIYNAFWDFWQPIEDFFWNIYEKVTAIIEETIENIKKLLKTGWNNIVKFFTETIPQLIDNIIEWFKNLPYMLGYQLGQIIGKFIKLGKDIWSWVTVDLPIIIQGIIDWFSKLPENIYNAFWDFWQPIEDFFWNIYEKVTAIIEETIENVGKWFSELPGRIKTWLDNTIENITTWGKNTYDTASQWVSNTIDSVTKWFSELPGRIWNWLLNTITKVINFGRDMSNKGKEAGKNLHDNIVNTIKELPGKMLETGKNIVKGLWNGIVNAKNWIIGKVKEFAKGILDGMKDALGIHSPSTKARDLIGKFIPEGVAVGVEANTDSALRAINKMNDEILSEMNRAVEFETGSINAKASVKSNNSMLNVIQATFNIDGSVDMDSTKVGRLVAPSVTKTIKAGGLV